MKKLFIVLATVSTLFSSAIPASAVDSQSVSGVSAYYRVDLGYKVGWQTPVNKTGIIGYTVTSNTGKTCIVKGATAAQCTYPAATLGYIGSFNFTVTTNLSSGNAGVSTTSNTVGARSIPSAPLAVSSSTISDTQIDVAWIPSSGTGNLPLYGYEVSYWKSDQFGQPITSTKQRVLVSQTYTSLSVSPSTMYIINVASCNALGCNSANEWTHSATTPITAQIQSIVFPRVLSGGSSGTTCFDSIYDANSGEISSGVCGSVIANPSSYPLVVSSATTVSDPVLPTKFQQQATLSKFLTSYPLSTWAPIGISWFANLSADSKSVTIGFTTPVNIYSKTSSICDVSGAKIVLKSIGKCVVEAQVGGDNTWLPSNIATAIINVIN